MLSEDEQKKDTALFWNFIRANFKLLLVYTLVGGFLAAVVTFFMPKEYKAYGLVYPPSSPSVDNSIDFPNFGYDIEADRLIQIFESTEIRDSVVKKFDLVRAYEIKQDNADWLDRLVKEYHKNIKFERTNSMSIVLSARSENADTAALIVNYIIRLADQVREKIYKKNILLAYDQAEKEYKTQKLLVDSAKTVLVEKLKAANLSSLLVLVSDALISIDAEKISLAASQSGAQASIGPDIIAFKSMYEILKDYQSRFLKIRKSVLSPIPQIFVINYAEPNFKKISPSFKVNIAAGMVVSLLIACVVLFIRHAGSNK